ncbi:MAG: DUF4136 domain-containing protein [Sphingomonadales bacterium]|nr:DUF4136 domain-containing protein [Sphingomonadales bacterium]MBD3775073.1 DUF4136 domain-containing protein [Paracoccaceae bacterium]
MKRRYLATALLGALALSACATAPGPVEVTRFVAPDRTAQLGQGTIFIESAPGSGEDSLELAPYKAAVAAELVKLGYVEAPRGEASQVAQVQIERIAREPADKRGPVSVGVGGSTGTYGSGVGLGIGINLGGGPKPQVETQLAVMIRDKASGQSIWEGRAEFSVAENSPLADADESAKAMAYALFREFPGNNGETVAVGVK